MLRPVLSGTAFTVGMVAAALPQSALAQNAPTPIDPNAQPTASGSAINLGAVTVQGQDPGIGNANANPAPVARMGDSIREVPRTINVVPAEVIQQQKATTLNEALRNVPGITMSSGEGNGGTNGDQYRIRGLAARGDAYVDGLKDFGIYAHDMFNTETVSVIKGPSSENFGSGGSGGIINQSTKKAGLTDHNRVQLGFGTGNIYRGTADLNRKISDDSAIRINALIHEEAGWRQYAQKDRKGLAVDFGTGIGTKTQWHLNGQYLRGDGRPDLGVSMYKYYDGPSATNSAKEAAAGTADRLKPITEYGLPNEISYIRKSDHDVTNHYQATSHLSHELNANIQLMNDTRVAFFDRKYSSTNPSGCDAACALAGNLNYGAGGGTAYKQSGYGLQNVLSARIEGEFAGLRHRMNVGTDINYTVDERVAGTKPNANTLGVQNIWKPKHDYGYSVSYPAANKRVDASNTNLAAFMNDRVWLHDMFSVAGGVRFDYVKTDVDVRAATPLNEEMTYREWSPSVALILEPTKDINVYTSFSRSFKPVGGDIIGANHVSNGGYAAANTDYEAEQIDTYELGGKVDLLNGRLGLTGAGFLIQKNQGTLIDNTGVNIASGEAGDEVELQGVELGVTGKLTNALSVFASYSYTTGEYKSGDRKGDDYDNLANHAGSAWVSYDLTEDLPVVPGNVTLASGVRYASSYSAVRTGAEHGIGEIPETFSWDAMASYDLNGYSVGVNVINITDHRNYASNFSTTRVVPDQGRTFMLTLGAEF